ncbi:hypothetical protein AB0G73_16580 [Streptomyces sp. NPDC020719]|uniref:hypothetical protein n=1 Tax=Streptomyces sp. NPDC020719 TaxID=3154896 RepID=UPI0033DA3490
MRLILLYGGMFLLCGALLLSVVYFLAARALHDGSGDLPFRVLPGSQISVSGSCPGLDAQVSPASDTNSVLDACLAQERRDALGDLLHRSLLALAGLTVIAFGFGYAMARRVLSPLGRITRAARRGAGANSRG